MSWTKLDSSSDEEEEGIGFDMDPGRNMKAYGFSGKSEKRKKLLIGGLVGAGVFFLIVVLIIALSGSSSPELRGVVPDPTDLRLPTHVMPTKYAVILSPVVDEGAYEGTVAIELAIANATEQIMLHKGPDVALSSAVLVGKSGEVWNHTAINVFEGDAQYVVMTFPPLYEATKGGETEFVLTIAFSAKLRDDMNGFYLSSYTEGGQRMFLAATQFESTGCRHAFPSFDEPAFKAVFDVSIIVDTTKYPTVLSNMPEKSRTKVGGALERVDFESSPRMSTYLVAFVVANYKKRRAPIVFPEPEEGDPKPMDPPRVEINVYSNADAYEQTVFAGKVARQALATFEEFFGIEYPLPKMDLVAIPDFSAGAMENWGLITFRTTDLLFSPLHSTESEEERVAVVVVHEIAHQWFGNLVTMEWWDEVWLNEGFATFMEYLIVDKMFSTVGDREHEKGWLMWEEFFNDQTRAMSVDQLINSHPIRQSVNTPSDIDLMFDSISYSKGGSLLYMLFRSNIMQNGNFAAGLTNYLNAHKYHNARSVELFQSLSKASNENDLIPMLDSWTAQPGYPVITFEQVGADNLYVAVQQRYLEQPAAAPSTSTWWVPLTLANDDDITTMTIMPGETKSKPFTISDRYFVANPERWGLYRVAYPADVLRALIAHVARNGIGADIERQGTRVPEQRPLTPLDYAGTLSDLISFSNSRFNNVSAYDVLALSAHVTATRSNLCWTTAIGAISHFGRLFDAAGDTRRSDLLNTFGGSLADAVIEDILAGKSGDEDDHAYQLLQLWLVPYAVERGNAKALGLVKDCWTKFLAGEQCVTDAVLKNQGPVPPQMQSAVFAYGAIVDPKNAYGPLMNLFINSTFPHEQARAERALTLLSDPEMRAKLLIECIPGGLVRSQDRATVVVRMSRVSRQARAETWAFLHDNISKLAGSTGLFGGVAPLVAGVGGGFATAKDVQNFKSFVDAYKAQGLSGRNIQQAIEAAEHNVEWLAQNTADVDRYFGKP